MMQRIIDAHAKLSLRAKFDAFKQASPRARAFDAALALGVSEVELLAAGCVGEAVRLDVNPAVLLNDLAAVGEVMALTRNEHAVIEKDGRYENLQINGEAGLIHHGGIDLRLFFKCWATAWAVETTGERVLRSLQFFDSAGRAVHKIYLRPDADIKAYAALVQRYRAKGDEALIVAAAPLPERARSDGEVDVEALRREWRALEDTHEFFGLIRRHRLTREQALRLAGEEFARQVPVDVLPKLMTRARDEKVPIMVFVGNDGAIEIHTGPVEHLKSMGTWFNVLDEGFNLHLNMAGLTSAWIVRKPTLEGDVTSFECFAGDGTLVIQLFGERKPGKEERADWRHLVTRTAV